MKKKYIFKIEGCELFEFIIDLSGLVLSEAISPYHFERAAASHAKMLARYTESDVTYYEEGYSYKATVEKAA